MSLLSEAMEPFVFLDRTTGKDSYGGITKTWTEGAEITAAAVFDSSMQARIGGVQGVTSLYTITTPRLVTLEYHDVIKRKSDGKIFRITSDGDDKRTPASASLDMRQVTAEEWTPNGPVVPAPQGGGAGSG